MRRVPLLPAGAAVPSGRGGRPRDPSRDGAIRAAVLSLLTRAGYGSLTMDAVATEAGVGKATIYRRWQTKSELVADVVATLDPGPAAAPDTGSLEGDLRVLLHWVVAAVNGPLGAATVSLLSTLPHEPELRAAFRSGPRGQWSAAFYAVWARAEARGEVRPGVAGSAVAASASAPILQRWLFGSRPVDEGYVEEVLASVVLPLVRCRCAAGR